MQCHTHAATRGYCMVPSLVLLHSLPVVPSLLLVRLALPSAPTGLALVGSSYNSLSFNWTLSDSSNSIRQYSVVTGTLQLRQNYEQLRFWNIVSACPCRQYGSIILCCRHVFTGLSATLSSLPAGTSFNVSVATRNEAGFGADTSALAASTPVLLCLTPSGLTASFD